MTTQHSGTNSDHGAAMVEFSLTALIFLGLIGAIFDFGITLHDYSRLTFITQHAARTGATIEEGNKYDAACKKAHSLRKRLGYAETWAKYSVTVSLSGSIPPTGCSIVVSSERKIDCFFCLFFRDDIIIRTTSIQPVEDNTFCGQAAASKVC